MKALDRWLTVEYVGPSPFNIKKHMLDFDDDGLDSFENEYEPFEMDDDVIDEDDALNYVEDLDDDTDPFEDDEEDVELDEPEPLDKIYGNLSSGQIFKRTPIVADDEDEIEDDDA